jgi:hypothetical protein
MNCFGGLADHIIFVAHLIAGSRRYRAACHHFRRAQSSEVHAAFSGIRPETTVFGVPSGLICLASDLSSNSRRQASM